MVVVSNSFIRRRVSILRGAFVLGIIMSDKNDTNTPSDGNGAPVTTGSAPWKTILWLSLITAVLCLVYSTSTPEFAIVEARYAIESKSVSTFERAVDVDAVSHNLVEDVFKSPLAAMFGGGSVGNWLSNQLGSVVQGPLENSFKAEIREAVTSGGLMANPAGSNAPASPAQSGLISAIAVSKQLGFDDYRYIGMDYFHREEIGEHKVLTLNFHSDKDNDDIAVKVELARADGEWFWRVVRISNFTDVSDFLVKKKAGKIRDGLGL